MIEPLKPGNHYHVCRLCFTVWQHSYFERGNALLHNCPVCGELNYKAYDSAEEFPKEVDAAPETG